MARQITLTLSIENTYEHYEPETTEVTVTVPEPTARDIMADDLEEWREEYINPHTGSASGTKTRGDSWADITVTASSNERCIAVGTTWEWGY